MERWNIFLPVCAILLLGCKSNVYQIEMTPDGKTLHRELTCWREKEQNDKKKLLLFPEDELEKIAKIYGQEVHAGKEKKHIFRGKFVGRTPSDVGGAGTYTHWATQMGTASAYVERFRGNDDLAGILQRSMNTADKISNLAIGWFESEIGDDPRFEKLHRFLDENFRQDLRNLAVYIWSMSIGETDGKNGDEVFFQWGVKIGQYFLERGYFTPETLPEILRNIHSDEKFLKHVREFIASKMEIEDPIESARILVFLADEDRAERSLGSYLRTTDEFQALREKWLEEKKENPDAEEPKPGPDFLKDMVADMLGFEPGSHDSLGVELNCPVLPYATNGKWNEEKKQVVWSCTILARSEDPAISLPALSFAFWAVPDDGYQKEHFGKVVLEGKNLAEYCFWRKGLSIEEAGEWDDFISSLDPGKDPRKQLEAFRFSSDPLRSPEDEHDPPSLGNYPRSLIKKGFEGEEN